MALLCSLFGYIPAADANELDNRDTISYPSPDTAQDMAYSSIRYAGGSNDAYNPTQGVVRLGGGGAANQGFFYFDNPIDLTRNNFSFTYNIQAPSGSTTGNEWYELGSAFVLFNDPTFSIGTDNDYGRLGIYGTADGAVAVKNSIAVEFDNQDSSRLGGAYRDSQSDPAGLARSGSHVAITDPDSVVYGSGQSIQHDAISYLPTPYSNGSINTARITWELIDPGATDSVTDNVYQLTYYYYQGASDASGTPTVTGSKTYSYSETVAAFGDPTQVRAGIGGSTGTLVGKSTTVSFPSTYGYTVNYYLQLPDGTRTTTTVPTMTSQTGRLPAGPQNLGTLMATPRGYRLVSGPIASDPTSTNVTIRSSGTNVFNYYYIDEPPVIEGAEPVTLERTTEFDPREGVTATDSLDGDLSTDVVIDGAVDTAEVGIYTLSYSVTDSGGNTVVVERVVTVVDTVPPAAPVIDPLTEPATVVTGVAEPGTTVKVTLPDGSIQTTVVATNGQWQIETESPLMGGQIVTAVATDSSGNASDEGNRTVSFVYVELDMTVTWDDPTTDDFPAAAITLLRDGSKYQEALVSSVGTSGSLTVTDLPAYAPDGREYEYTITAGHQDGYTTDVSGNSETGYLVTYSRILGRVDLTKTVGEGSVHAGEGIEGATYELFDINGTSVGTYVTDVNGLISVDQLVTGDYYFQEIVAPDGYRLAEQAISFTITDETPIDLQTVDYPLVNQFPETGTIGYWPYYGIGTLLCGGAIILLLRHNSYQFTSSIKSGLPNPRKKK